MVGTDARIRASLVTSPVFYGDIEILPDQHPFTGKIKVGHSFHNYFTRWKATGLPG